MIDDMNVRGFIEDTRRDDIRCVKNKRGQQQQGACPGRPLTSSAHASVR